MFEALPKARAGLKPGTLYALLGEQGWIYYGQVNPEKSIGFLRGRSRSLRAPEDVLACPILSVVCVSFPSIGRALRAGEWKKLGRFPVHPELEVPPAIVQWPVGTLVVTVWTGGEDHYDTRVEDPAIQDLELMAVWDAHYHVPGRLTADFGAEEGEWHVGGPIWRERRIKEEIARRCPDQPWHQLPTDWVATNAQRGSSPTLDR
jgi:hypothetical protein